MNPVIGKTLAWPIREKYHDLNKEDHGQPFAAALPMQQHAESLDY